ncbi:MAG: shikimate dehydrogenase, partial [Alphaproteobacteria bacterium]|nr:shikimate dehydrogenase [Alphaproteobacteria bacterium]
LAAHGIDGAYVPLAVAPEHLATALAALPALGVRGVNLTIPHKQTGLAVLDGLGDRAAIDPTARRVGAVNTVTVLDDGRLWATNTDAYGFIENIRDCAPDWEAGAGPAVILGAGGAARAVAVALVDAGVPRLVLANRTRDKADRLAGELAGGKTEITAADWQDRATALAGATLLVNTTSLGMIGQPPLEIELKSLPGSAVVSDIVYAPLETDLLRAAAGRGNISVDGLGMLLHQARPAFAAWFGVEPAVTPELRARVLADAPHVAQHDAPQDGT